ncbi:MAG: tyrosine-protein phosphatase [Ilumatobacteraceae bacterium]
MAEQGRFPVDKHAVEFHHLSILDQTWDNFGEDIKRLPVTEFLHRAYSSMLRDGAPKFVEAFHLLGSPDALPAVFHCAAGKDRTGILAVLVLGALGVERESIVADYALTSRAMSSILARLSSNPERAAKISQAPPSFFAADGDAIRLLLDDIERTHGSVRAMVLAFGVDEASLVRLEEHLLVG